MNHEWLNPVIALPLSHCCPHSHVPDFERGKQCEGINNAS